jgi:ParB-like chromosome segregation protein Spo0J
MDTISPDLQDLKEKVEDLSLHPDNPRRGDVELIKRSLSHFGQIRPIVTTDDGVIIAGNHTFRAALELGWTEIAAVRVTLSEDDAEAYLLMDNKAADSATWDDAGLLSVLDRMASKDMLEVTGFSVDELEDLEAAIATVNETEHEEFTGDYAEPEGATAERWEGRDEGLNREVVFLLPHADFEKFMDNVGQLKTIYDKESSARCIYIAVENAVALHTQRNGAEKMNTP